MASQPKVASAVHAADLLPACSRSAACKPQQIRCSRPGYWNRQRRCVSQVLSLSLGAL